jgi:hypothetical protein
MAISWAYKRRLLYGGGVIIFLALVSSGIFFRLVYKAPTCFDGKKNSDETGIDCGGSCTTLCKNDAVDPVVIWSKIFNISGYTYSAVAYVENPNLNSKASKADYAFKIYDEKHNLLDTKSGSISIPKGKKFAVFEPGLEYKNAKPKYAEFEFMPNTIWQKDMSVEPDIFISNKPLSSASTTPRIEGTITNNSTQDIAEIELTTFVLDSMENVVAASRTFINDLYKKTSQDFFFTWPKPFNLGVEACTNNVDLALVLDKSGSMKTESLDPPEPFSTVKITAQNFINNLSDKDQVSIASFGDNGSVDGVLSADKTLAVQAIESLSLGTTSQQTNITEGLKSGWIELNSSAAKPENRKVLVLLTDGAPTAPRSTTTPDFPKISAEAAAREIASSSVTIFTIGLGKDVNEGFLKNLSGDDKRYFFAPNKDVLSSIYKNIGSALCKRKPNVITVMYRIP